MTDSPTVTTPVFDQAEQAIMQDTIMRYNNPDYSTQAVEAVRKDTKDRYGNSVMSLGAIGLNSVVRFVRKEEGLRLSKIDIAVAVHGKNKHSTGTIVL